MTRRICGAIYPTLSLINLYMYLLKNSFASHEEIGESFDTYLELIYGSIINEEEDDDIVSDNEYIPSGGSRQHWQYAYRYFHQQMGDGKVEAKILVRELYNDIKQDLSSKNNENLFSNPSLLDDSDIFKALEDDVSLEEKENDEINLYLQQRKIGLNDDPLK
ncbi:4488_t:CDS:2, partial [Funneliformis geosporum]